MPGDENRLVIGRRGRKDKHLPPSTKGLLLSRFPWYLVKTRARGGKERNVLLGGLHDMVSVILKLWSGWKPAECLRCESETRVLNGDEKVGLTPSQRGAITSAIG